jgi:hypothetical protein
MPDLLLRIRAESLRLNLAKAHSSLQKLPNLSDDLKKVREKLDAIRENVGMVANTLAELREPINDNIPSYLDRTRTAHNTAEDIGSGLREARKQVQEIEDKSFLVQIRTMAEDIFNSLDPRAKNLIDSVNGIEGTIRRGGSESEAWGLLAAAGADASEQVFEESIELLGGIALRDARLDANICELADALIASIYRAARQSAHAIPGGISSMNMTLERIIRIPFPQWTVWALPFAAHEFFHVALKREMRNLSEIARVSTDADRLLGAGGTDLCLADVFATYTMGPAYAYAAITVLLDPTRAEDEARVHAILGTLAGLSPGNSAGPDDLSYPSVVHLLRSEWEAARGHAFAALARDDSRVQTHFAALHDLNPCPLEPAGAAYRAKLDELQSAWKTAATCSAATRTAAQTDYIDSLVASTTKVLADRGIPSFAFAEWRPLREWVQPLQDGTVGRIDIANCDLRHAINAAWLARVNQKRPAGKDLTGAAMDLGRRIREATAVIPANPRSLPRI